MGVQQALSAEVFVVSKRKRGTAARFIAAAGFFYPGLRSFGQTAVNVSVNANSPITYADGAAIATMPATGLGLCTSVYANMWGDPNLPADIAGSGVQMLRYPGGSYSDIYNWSLNTANEGGYVGPDANIGNFLNVINAAGTQAMITVNYGSNTTDTMGARRRRRRRKLRMRMRSREFTEPIRT